MTRRRPAPPRTRQRGIALLVVMWVFMVLGVIALDFSRYMRDDAMAGLNFADEVRGYYLAIGGMNRELLRALEARQAEHGRGPRAGGSTATAADRDTDQPELGLEHAASVADGQPIHGQLAGGQYVVTLTDEASKIPINTFPEDALRQALWNLFVGGNRTTAVNRRQEADIDTIADSILDWRDCGNEVRPHGAESAYYNGLPHPYDSKNAFFDAPEEILLVRGVTPELFYGEEGQPGLRDVFSVYTKDKVNLRTISPAVMQMVLGIDADTAADLASRRGELDASAASQLVEVQARNAAPQIADCCLEDQEPQTIMVVAKGNANPDAGIVRDWGTMAAVVELSGDEVDGIRLLRWFDRAPWTGALPGLSPEAGSAG